MSSTAGHEDTRPLCDRCRLLLSTEELLKRAAFKHSPLRSFESRPWCQFCSYLWNEKWLEGKWRHHSDWKIVAGVGRLRDLVEVPAGVDLPHANEIQKGSVVLSFKISFTEGARGVLRDRDFDHEWHEHRDYSIYWDSPSNTFHFPTVHGTTLGAEAFDIALYVNIENEAGKIISDDLASLDLVTTDDSLCANVTKLRHIDWNRPIQQWIPAVKNLLTDCHRSHEKCQPPAPKPLPKRLLRVRANQPSLSRVRLCVAPHESRLGHYAALSYCWGGPQRTRLTKSNIDELRQGMDAPSLPQTLQDAILVTQLLGLEYLWVDALCIVQDDDADKSAQVSQMQGIYENSAVTISAASASSVEQGFLSFPGWQTDKQPSCDVALRFDNYRLGPLSLVPAYTHKTNEFPLNRRGWTLQESMLPPRLLVFGDLEPFLRCRTESMVHVARSPVRYPHLIQPPRFNNNNQATLATALQFQYREAWTQVIQQYTDRELGFGDDRPYAIAGVNAWLADILQDKCYFGVWDSQILQGLFWKVEHRRDRASGHVTNCPSWSWMSVLGRASTGFQFYKFVALASVQWGADPEHREIIMECRILTLADVMPNNVRDSWPDIPAGDVAAEDNGSIKNHRWADDVSFLVLYENYNIWKALVATDQGQNVYKRIGLVDLERAKEWLERPKKRIMLK